MNQINFLLLSGCLLAASCTPSMAFAADLPDAKVTPGVIRAGVTAADLCPVAHTPALRNVSEAEKRQVYMAYGLAGNHNGYCASLEGCEVDHLISLEIGGANDIGNLWPEPYDGTVWNAHVKDKLENKLHALVCAGTITLATAQHDVATNWIAAYKLYIGPVSK
jgi:hypothetical protein